MRTVKTQFKASFSLQIGQYAFTPKLLPTLATLLLLPLLISLGYWQLDRAKQKQQLLQLYQGANSRQALALNQITDNTKYLRYQRVTATGHYANKHQILLDNRTYQGQVGYHVITAFKPNTGKRWLLVNRGWIPLGKSRQQLPTLAAVNKQVSIMGHTQALRRKHFVLSQQAEKQTTWPHRVQYLQLKQLEQQLGHKLYPFILLLSDQATHGFVRKWNPITMTPARHRGYAVQWFALALTLVIIFIVTNTRKKE